jgi:hypothetical protein
MASESDLWIDICKNLFTLDSHRTSADQVIGKISKAHAKLAVRDSQGIMRCWQQYKIEFVLLLYV